MSIKTSLWSVEGNQLKAVPHSTLDSERQLEDWLNADPSLLERNLLIIGRQTRTISGPLDFLAIDREGELVIIELKRDRTPRDVVAQVLDYAAWIRQLNYEQIDAICVERHGKSLAETFRNHFGFGIPENAATEHSMLIVASELDDSSERIVAYLQQVHDVNINAVYFTTFELNGNKLLARAWLADPVETVDRIEAKRKRPWSGLWFVNNGVDGTNGRSWEACQRYGFLSAGGGRRYSDPLYRLDVGDEIVAYQNGHGYVGYGVVKANASQASDFQLAGGKTLTETIPGIDPFLGNPEECEHAIAIEWKCTVPVEQAKWFKGAFANQNVVCKLRDEQTVDFLRLEFSIAD